MMKSFFSLRQCLLAVATNSVTFSKKAGASLEVSYIHFLSTGMIGSNPPCKYRDKELKNNASKNSGMKERHQARSRSEDLILSLLQIDLEIKRWKKCKSWKKERLESENQPFTVLSFTKIKGKISFPRKWSLLGF
jgi:hypothetical protein